MKLSCTPISLAGELRSGHMDLRGYVDFCAEIGFDAVDLLDTRCYPWLWGDARPDLEAAAAHVTAAGLAVAAHGCGNNFALSDRDEWTRQVELVRAAIREAAALGAPVLRIFGGKLAGLGMEPDAGIRLVQAGIEACLPAAEEYGVVLGLENHGGLPGNAFELKGIVDAVGSPWLRCTFDCGNFIANSMVEVEDPLAALRMLQADVVHVHVKDFGPHRDPTSGRRVEARVAGDGEVPLRQLTAMLEMAGYNGWYTLEFEASALVPERAGVTRSYQFLRQTGRLHASLGLGPKRTVGARVSAPCASDGAMA